MSWLQTIAIFPRPPDSRPIRQLEQEILDELEFHVEMRTLDNISAGMSPCEARQNAVNRFGDFRQIYMSCRRTVLGERIMLQRVQAVLSLVLLGAVIYMGVELYHGQRANEAATERMMQALDKIAKEPAEGGQAQSEPATSKPLYDDPPIVVQTSPRSGDADVDPSLQEIRVTFNKKMLDQSWSWTQISDETFPQTTGEPRYDEDGKTCVLPVKLQPGKSYVIWLNSEKFGNFKDREGLCAVPYNLHFQTRQ